MEVAGGDEGGGQSVGAWVGHRELALAAGQRRAAARFTVALRIASWTRTEPLLKPLDLLLRLWLLRVRHRYGFELAPTSEIGGGLLLSSHPGGITVNPEVRIGRNCNLFHGVTSNFLSHGAISSSLMSDLLSATLPKM